MNVWQGIYLEWVQGRLDLARNLANQRGYSVADAGVILGALISALSSDFLIRPSENGDKKRFIQLLVDDRVVGPNQLFRKISLPSLLSKYRDDNNFSCIKEMVGQQFEKGDGLHGSLASSIIASDVDTLSDDEVARRTSLSLLNIRRHSYAHIFYENVRCSYLHEYRSGNVAFLVLGTDGSSSDVASYTTEMELCFSLTECENIVKAIAEKLANNVEDGANSVQFEAPTHFWIDG